MSVAGQFNDLELGDEFHLHLGGGGFYCGDVVQIYSDDDGEIIGCVVDQGESIEKDRFMQVGFDGITRLNEDQAKMRCN